MIGVVLAGGLSSRLGQDKTRLRLHGPNRPRMLERTVELLRACTEETVISCRGDRPPEDPDGALAGVPLLMDDAPGQGPLGGMHTCLRRLGGPILVLSCDLPFMEPAVLERLLAARATRKPHHIMTTYRQVETGYIEALVAVYEPACLPWFDRAAAAGVRQLNLVVPEDLRYDVPYTRAENRPFFNVNYPEDLRNALREIAP